MREVRLHVDEAAKMWLDAAQAGDPVRRGFSIQSQSPLEYWVTRFCG
jgi:hypothetical protein